MTIARLFGVRIILNRLFLVLLLLLSAVGMFWETIILFGVVFLHELAHMVTAQASGLSVREVELLPFGGVARIDDLLEFDPSVEKAVAIAGPLTNAFLYGIGVFARNHPAIPPDLLEIFLRDNVIIGLFNLVPALPLDGGRILRAMMARRIGFRRATERAAKLGKVCALVIGVAGGVLMYHGQANISFFVLAGFVYIAAGKEQGLAAYVFMRYLTRKQRELARSGSMVAHQIVALEATSLKEVMNGFVPQRYHVIWVLDTQGRIHGITSEMEVIEAAFQLGVETQIGQIAREPPSPYS